MPTVTRYDFIDEGTRCSRIIDRRHTLKRGAYYVRYEDGREFPFGEQCLQLQFGKGAHLGVPDLTIRGIYTGSNKANLGKKDSDNISPSVDSQKDKSILAKRYLCLRMRLAKEKNANASLLYDRLIPIYNKYLGSGVIESGDVDYILKINSSDKTPPEFKIENLLDVNAALHQLDGMLRKDITQSWREYLEMLISAEN